MIKKEIPQEFLVKRQRVLCLVGDAGLGHKYFLPENFATPPPSTSPSVRPSSPHTSNKQNRPTLSRWTHLFMVGDAGLGASH